MVTAIRSDITRFKVQTRILEALFSAEDRRLQKAVDQIHEHNQEALKKTLDGFQFQGKFYKHSRSVTGMGSQLPTLHMSIWPEMEAHLVDRARVEEDRQLIGQVLHRLLYACIYIEQIRDAVPECIVDTLPPEIAALERQHNVLFFVNNDRDLRQFNKALPKIEFYSAARLLY